MKTTIATTARRTGFWLLMADRYFKIANESKTEARRAFWLKRAVEAEKTAAA